VPNDLSPAQPKAHDPEATSAALPVGSETGITADRTATRPADTNPSTIRTGPATAVELPGYEFIREVNRGGMGIVYEARQVTLNRTVAVKLVLGDARAESRALARFKVEAEAVAAVRHPNVLQVHDCGEHLGRAYLILEYCPGGTLADRLKEGQRLAPGRVADLVGKVARGVAAAHARGIIHRDLKPGNILFGEDGAPKVADFGLAKLQAGANLTQAGDVMGTPAYMAPEQAGGRVEEVGTATDVWSLGVILYECLAGTRPFHGESTTEILAVVQAANAEPVRRRAPEVPRDLEFICLKCLRKNPRDRYATAGELADDLERYANGQPLGGRREERIYRWRRRAIRYWKPAAAAAALAMGGLWWTTRPPPVGTAPVSSLEPAEDPAAALKKQEVIRRVEGLTQVAPNPDREPPHPLETIKQLPPADLSAFRIISDDRVIDMRGWRDLEPEDRSGESYVLYRGRRVLLKTAPADSYRIEGRTGGRDLIMRLHTPNPDRARAFQAETTKFVGGQPLKVRQLLCDVSTVPVGAEFSDYYTSTFWSPPMRDPEDRWFGAIGYEGSFKITMLLIFPQNKPFQSYTLRVAPTRKDPPVPFTGPVITFKADDNRWLYWEIPSPAAGQVYRVDWTW
jgi:hypothetical protein